jgi:ABC-type phosphate transport system substrate-binding protein
MKSFFVRHIILFVFASSSSFSQQVFTASIGETSNASVNTTTVLPKKNQQIVRITGVRFAYPLVQQWIDNYNKEYPDVQIIIESRASSDPSQYDILIEAYEHSEEVKSEREYAYIARYAVLPIANSKSAFANRYTDKGLNKDLIVQLFFHDIYADKEGQKEIKDPFTVYTRLQKAGAPITFARYFGYEQKDIKGKSIAGADEHILKALLRDTTGLSYLPLSLIYDRETKKPVEGIAVLPVDLNGNDKVNDDEKFYDDLSTVTQRFEEASAKDLNNVPVEYLHFSVDKKSASAEAIAFVKWVISNGQTDLHDFGYLKPEPGKLLKDKSELFASKRVK